jgi:hypothetical protein
VLRKQPVGSIGRVPAPELEAAVVDAIRRHLQAAGADPKPIPATDRELIKRHLRRVTLSATELRIDVHLGGGGSEAAVGADAETTMGIPWAQPIRRGAAVNPSEELRHHAAECNRMANSTRGDEKATWSQMAERWLACAKQAVQFRIKGHRSTVPKPQPTPSTT